VQAEKERQDNHSLAPAPRRGRMLRVYVAVGSLSGVATISEILDAVNNSDKRRSPILRSDVVSTCHNLVSRGFFTQVTLDDGVKMYEISSLKHYNKKDRAHKKSHAASMKKRAKVPRKSPQRGESKYSAMDLKLITSNIISGICGASVAAIVLAAVLY